jgi:hypothetical protein
MANDQENLPPSERGREPIALHVRCRNCLFFKQAAYFKAPCSQLGVEKYARPCTHFTANHYNFNVKDKNYIPIAQMINSLSSDRLGEMVALLSQEIRTRRQGFRHNQTVFVHAFGDDYLSNYCKAAVITANRTYVFVQGLGKDKTFRGSFLRSSVLNEEEYDKKRKTLIRKKLLRDPNLASYTQYRPPNNIKEPYSKENVPTIDRIIKPKVVAKKKKTSSGFSMSEIRRHTMEDYIPS